VLFVATTAEESGLLGSEAYTRDPLVPLDQTAAVINLDVTNVRGATRDIDALGVDRSMLGAVFDAAARAESLAVVHEPDVRGSFYRSDHFPFSKAGVPALSIEPGRDFVGRPAGWGEQEARATTASATTSRATSTARRSRTRGWRRRYGWRSESRWRWQTRLPCRVGFPIRNSSGRQAAAVPECRMLQLV